MALPTIFFQLFGLNGTTITVNQQRPGESFHQSSCVPFISCLSWIRGPSNKLFHYHQSIAVLTFIKEVKLAKILQIDFNELEKVEQFEDKTTDDVCGISQTLYAAETCDSASQRSSDEISINIHIKNSPDHTNASITESYDFHVELFKCNVCYVGAECYKTLKIHIKFNHD